MINQRKTYAVIDKQTGKVVEYFRVKWSAIEYIREHNRRNRGIFRDELEVVKYEMVKGK